MRTIFFMLLAIAPFSLACDPAPSAGEAPAATNEQRTVYFSVSGMTCGGCEQAITQALLQQQGVLEAGADHKAGTAWARVGPGASEPGALAAAIDALGYRASVTTAEP